jgi:glycosyltransferase involved in cell wall biosynthesis
MSQPKPNSNAAPAVSIILPTFNRASFLPQAFASMRSQEFQDWELIVVDDGSTDDTRACVAELTRGWQQPVRYLYQSNQGPYGARKTGYDAALGEFIAFFDTDDVWLGHHLHDCVEALRTNPDVGWVYGSCRIVELATGAVRNPSSFYEAGRPKPFQSLPTRQSGRLQIIEARNPALAYLRSSFYCGLQCSVIRTDVFRSPPFQVRRSIRIGEDIVFALIALAQGCRFGYFNNVHTIYNVHDDNISAAAPSIAVEKNLNVCRAMAQGLESVRDSLMLSRAECTTLNRRISEIYFWRLGYTLLWQNGRCQEALKCYRHGLKLWPWDLACWKTYGLAWLRMVVGRQPANVARSVN